MTDAGAPLSPNELVAHARRHLELEEAYGVARIPFSQEQVDQYRAGHAEQRRKAQPAPPPAPEIATSRPVPAANTNDLPTTLRELEESLQGCQRCALGERRTNLVFGEGAPDADLMFIGEAPGQHEDEQGRPFVGAAGQLLTRIIEAIGMQREEVYIANICKCRPPGNRTPLPDEAAACLPYLMRQIELIKPRIIVAMGNPATKTLLQTTTGITRMRGKFVNWNGVQVMPTFHPSYLLRTPQAKREVWEDMQKVHARMKELGLKTGELKKGRSSR